MKKPLIQILQIYKHQKHYIYYKYNNNNIQLKTIQHFLFPKLLPAVITQNKSIILYNFSKI